MIFTIFAQLAIFTQFRGMRALSCARNKFKTVAVTNGCKAAVQGSTQITLELIRSNRVLVAGSAHNVLSVVTYQSVSSRLKVILTGVCVLLEYLRVLWK